MQERVFMGIGNKPFMDIQPSDAAINDRAVNYVLMGRGEKILPVRQVYVLSLFGFSKLIILPLIQLILICSPQKTRCCPLWDHVGHRMGFLGRDQNLLLQGALHLPPHPLEGAPCPMWDTCVGRSGGWLRVVLRDTYHPLGFWRRTTWTMRVGVRTYCVSVNFINQLCNEVI